MPSRHQYESMRYCRNTDARILATTLYDILNRKRGPTELVVMMQVKPGLG